MVGKNVDLFLKNYPPPTGKSPLSPSIEVQIIIKGLFLKTSWFLKILYFQYLQLSYRTYLWFNENKVKRTVKDTVLVQFLETETSDRTLIGLDQLQKCLGFSLYPLLN